MRGTWMTWGVAAIVWVSTSAGAATGLGAQQAAITRNPEAVQLERRAQDLSFDNRTFGEAARMYRKAAEVRGTKDPVTVTNLRWAGRLAYYAGNATQAVNDLKRAGDLALEWGDVLGAAESFFDAAWIAQKHGRPAEAVKLADRGKELSEVPFLGAEQKAALQGRVRTSGSGR